MTNKNEISNYKYIKTIGEGTFGKVKLATHIITGEKVAIKILQKNLIKDQNEYDRIEREIKYLKLFNHPNIIQIYEVLESSSSFYIVMEYAPGGELFNYIVEKEKLTEKETSFYFYQIIQAVKEIHKKKICHRDIKPENLLFTKNKILKIIDFGLSSEYDEYLSTPCGSPCYASPEMIRGKKYNGLSIDLWACGIILFAMLCGYLPFDDKNNNELFRKILECKIDYPEEDEVELSEISLDLINKILTSNPSKRIGINKILEHPFMNYGKKVYNTVIRPDFFTHERLIIDYMTKELGFKNNNNIIEKYIHSNRHNNITTTYYLLKQKYIDGRLNYSFKEKLIKKISKTDCSNNIFNKKNSNNNIYNNSLSFNNNNNSYSNSNRNNFSKKKIVSIKKKFECDEKFKNLNNNITYNNFNYNHKKRNKTSSCSQSKKNLLSLKEMIKNKNLIDTNNIIIINNTNMIQQSEKIKPIYNNLYFKQENSKKNNYRKIETSVSLEKNLNKNSKLITNIKANINPDTSKLNNTYQNNKNNLKREIKVCLKKDEKNENPYAYFKKFKANELLNKKKYIYLPSQNFSTKSNIRNSHKHKHHIQNDFLTNKKNSTGIGGFSSHLNNIYSFDVNSSNCNTSLTNNYINALSYDTTNFNYNKNSENVGETSSSRNKKNNFKNILITEEISNKYQYKSKFLNNNNEENLSSTIEINKENTDITNKRKIKNKLDNNKIKYVKNIENICKKIFKQNNKRYINYIKNNKKASYDNKSKEKKRIEENLKKKLIYSNNKYTNRELKNIKKEYLCPSTYRLHKENKNMNNLNINNLNNKIIVKNFLSKHVNSNYIPKKSNQSEIQTSIENNFNKLKNLIKNNPIFFNKKNCESFYEKNNRDSIKNKTFKNLTPNDNNTSNNVNINTVTSLNKKSKINRNIKEILSLKTNIKKNNKNKIKNKSNIGIIFKSEKEYIQFDSSSRNNINKSNYIPITSRDKPLHVSRNQNYEISNNIAKSNTELIDPNKIFQNNFLSDRKNNKNKESYNLLNSNGNKNKKQNNTEKFLSANTEMSLHQIYEKIVQFCKENNLEYKKKGKNNFIILDQNFNNSFIVEIIDSSSKKELNIVKFYQGKNTGVKMKEMSTKLFIEIFNFQ